MSDMSMTGPPARSLTVAMGNDAKSFTMIYPYYENPLFLRSQVYWWARWTGGLPAHVQLVVVDDGSPYQAAAEVLKPIRQIFGLPFPTRLFRIDVDIRWNWLAARNIGAHHAEDGWLLLTDMDHVVTPTVARSLIFGRHDPGVVYRFSRVEHSGQKIHPHPNSWFMTRKMYWRIGGYDEAASGYYGTDGEYRRRVAETAPVVILSDALVRFEYQDDSSTTSYRRKQPEDARGKAILRARRGMAPNVLSFPYHEVPI